MSRTDRKLGLPRPRPALSTDSEAIWGCSACPLLSTRTRTNVRGDANKCSDFGKKWKKSVHKKFTKNFSKTLDFLKIPACSTIVGRTNRTPNPLLYHIPQDLSIGKMHKNLPPRRAVFRVSILDYFQFHLQGHQGQYTLSLRHYH